VVAEMYRLLGGKVGVGAVSGKPVAAFDYQPALQVPAH
jgi:hypothetical protein